MSHGVIHAAKARNRKARNRKSRLDGKSPRYLLSVLTHMGRMADVVNREARSAPKHGPRALKRAAKRRRYAANVRRNERNGWRAYYEEEKRRARAAS